MTTTIRLLALVAFFGLVLAQSATAQYYDSRVLEKSFERAEFFFGPVRLNPYGLTGIGRTAPGLIEDPLLDSHFSPSMLGSDTTDTPLIYIDFRGHRDRTQQYNDIYPTILYSDTRSVSDLRYPVYFRSAVRRPEPLLAAAVQFSPSPTRLPGLRLELSYQVIAEDQPYYTVPQDVYRSSPGTDLAGTALAEDSFPVTEIYLGEDEMHFGGSMPAVTVSYELSPKARIGVRAAYATFDRDGATGNTQRQPSVYQPNTYFWSNLEERNQHYSHVDLSVGADVALASGWRLGGALGYLDGTATQRLSRADSSFNTSEWDDGTYTSEGRYLQGGTNESRWDHEGGTAYATLFARRTLANGQLFTASYQGFFRNEDLSSRAALRDTSYSFSTSQGPSYRNEYEYVGSLLDRRTGSGESSGYNHRLTASLQWNLSEATQLSAGAVLELDKVDTHTTESVEHDQFNSYYNMYDGGTQSNSERIIESKELRWTFSSRRTAFRVPLYLTHRLSEQVQLIAALSRDLTSWHITDETLAVFDRRVRITNEGTFEERGFGELYREPSERRTDSETNVLLGLVVTPATGLDIRILVSPYVQNNYDSTRRYQWWLGFQLRP